MTIKLDALASWKLMAKGEALKLEGGSEDTRRIRIDVNCEDKTWVYAAAPDIEVEAQFLAAVGPGLETIEFFAGGDLLVTFAPAVPEERVSQVWVYTAEIEQNVVEVPDAVSFTEPYQRRAIDPHVAMMQLIARQNEERMERQIAAMSALVERNERATSNVDTGTSDGAAGAAGGEPSGGAEPPSGEDKAGGSEPPSGAGDGNAG